MDVSCHIFFFSEIDNALSGRCKSSMVLLPMEDLSPLDHSNINSPIVKFEEHGETYWLLWLHFAFNTFSTRRFCASLDIPDKWERLSSCWSYHFCYLIFIKNDSSLTISTPFLICCTFFNVPTRVQVHLALHSLHS